MIEKLISDLSGVKKMLEPVVKELAWKMEAVVIEMHGIDILKEPCVLLMRNSRGRPCEGVAKEGWRVKKNSSWTF